MTYLIASSSSLPDSHALRRTTSQEIDSSRAAQKLPAITSRWSTWGRGVPIPALGGEDRLADGPHRHPGGPRSGNGPSVPDESRLPYCKTLTNSLTAVGVSARPRASTPTV